MLIAANIAIVVLALLSVPLAIRSRLQRWVACAFVSGAVETLAKLWISPFLRAQPRPLHGAGFAVFLLERFMLLGVDVVVVAALIAIYGMARQRWWRASIWAGAAVWLVMATTYVHGAGPGPYRIAGFAFGPKYLFLAAAIVNAAVSSAAMVFGLRPALARARSNADFAAVVSMTAFSAGVTLRLALPAVPGLTIGWEYVAAFLMAVYITVGGVQTAALAAGPLKAISPTIQRSLQRLRRELALSEMARALGRTRARLDSIATPWAARYVALHRLGEQDRAALGALAEQSPRVADAAEKAAVMLEVLDPADRAATIALMQRGVSEIAMLAGERDESVTWDRFLSASGANGRDAFRAPFAAACLAAFDGLAPRDATRAVQVVERAAESMPAETTVSSGARVTSS